MCGIAGCISKNKPVDKEKFHRMVDIIKYRGPDDQGEWFKDNIAFGHCRLSIIDISEAGHQPYSFQDYVLIFNGEIYNYIEIRSELEEIGCSFSSESDTEVLLKSYIFWGKECVKHFNGMWAFAIYDPRENIIFCSRDRFGVKPFYYTFQEGMFLFGSEIKQLLVMLNDSPHADRETLINYLVNGELDYSKKTLFYDIYQLRGGENLVFYLEDCSYDIKRYYNIGDTKEKRESFSEASKKFREAFSKSIELRLRSDVQLGYCLSGGLDSSAIVCQAFEGCKNRKSQWNSKAITSCSRNIKYDEQEYVDAVVEKTGVKSYRVFPEEQGLFECLDEMIWHMDEPFGSTSIFAQRCVFKEAHRLGIKVMLDGQGADEQLAGYSGFYKVLFSDLLLHGKFRKLISEWNDYLEKRANCDFENGKGMLFSAISKVFVPKEIRKRIKPYFQLKSGVPFELKVLKEAAEYAPNSYEKTGRKYINNIMSRSLPELLHYEDRNSMTYSVESRVPFLDVELVNMIYAMPFEYKIRNGITKSVMREGLKDILPEKVGKRISKLGFVTPEDQWINDNQDEFEEVLYDSVDYLSSLVDLDMVKKWYSERKGNFQVTDKSLWRLICAGRWVKVFNVKF